MLKVIEYDGNLKEIAQKLNNRKEEISIEVNNAVNDIINDIRKNGNQALINYCRKFDGYQIKDENDFVVSNQEKEEALKQVDQDYIRILERTKQQITEFHKNAIETAAPETALKRLIEQVSSVLPNRHMRLKNFVQFS